MRRGGGKLTPKTVPKIEGYYRPIGPYSHMTIAKDFVFISMQTPLKPEGNSKEFAGPTVKEQTHQILTNLKTLLAEVKCPLDDIVKVTIYLTHPKDFIAMNEVYKEFFPEEPPARSVAKLGIEAPNLLIAADFVAVQKK